MDDLILLHAFYRCSHLLHASGKGLGQQRLLILLLQRGSLTQRELTDLTERRSATLSEQLDHMEQDGYIQRRRTETDRRNITITLTPAGTAAALTALEKRKTRAAALFAGLTDSEKEQLLTLLQTLMTAWESLPNSEEVKPS